MTRKPMIWPPLSIGVLVFLLLFLSGAAGRIEAAPALDELAGSQSPLNCRFGVAISADYRSQASWMEPLGAGWYLDFSSHAASSLTNAEFVQVIRVLQKKVDCDYMEGYDTWPKLTEAELGAAIARHPGALWVVGNEPDRGPNPGQCWLRGQGDTMPEVYAQAYHDTYAFIKAHDPTARVANAGLVQVTPGRLQYLDKVWDAYLSQYGAPMPVDVWSFHLYILPEARADGQPNGAANIALGTDPALAMRESDGDPGACTDPKVYCYAEHDDMIAFSEQVVAMRTWMKQHGQQNKPLILTEYSLLYPYVMDDPGPPPSYFLCDEYGQCFTPERVRNFMIRSLDYLDSAADPLLGYPADGNRLVQRWLWFGTFFSPDPEFPGYVSNLLTDSQTALTSVGELFQSSVANRSSYLNLRPDPIPLITARAQAGIATATLWVNVYNIGTAPTTGPFTVTFYSDSALTQPIGSTVVAPGLAGCEGGRMTATVSWPGRTVGSHRFWLRLDSEETIIESNEADNIATGVVTVLPSRVYFPTLLRS